MLMLEGDKVPYCEECRLLTLPDTVHYCDDCCEKRLASARAIMEKFVGKVDSGTARNKETYREMKAWLEE